MKAVVNIVRVIVGLLFIFSGLVKAIDPLGLSYKMQEFFELWKMSDLNSWTLLFSILMNAFEIIAGFALLLGWRIKLFSWLLLLLILFFTFLTGYAYLSGKFKNCGCFGDCIPITAQTSFLKDIILTVLIGFLFWQRNKIKPLFSEKATTWLMLLVTALSLGLQWYSLTYLPPVDCLPYKKGNNIPEEMKMPANAVPDSTVITFVYEKDGKQVEFTADKFPADFSGDTYKFISRYDKVIKKGKNNEPPIKGFALSGNSNVDSTNIILEHPYAVLAFIENFKVPVSKWETDFEKLYAEAKAKNIPVYFVVTNMAEAADNFKGTSFVNAPLLKCDFTAIRTAARTSPCVYLLNQGTIVDKKSYKNISDITVALKPIAVQKLPDPVVEPLQDTVNQQPVTSNQQP
jgi:uncharacterized membrane protein YphA (DoxX/SURF4 family)